MEKTQCQNGDYEKLLALFYKCWMLEINITDRVFKARSTEGLHPTWFLKVHP